MILHSKITEITPKRPQITPDHTRSSQEHAFGTYFLTGPRQNSFSSLSPFPPKTEGTPSYFKWPFQPGDWVNQSTITTWAPAVPKTLFIHFSSRCWGWFSGCSPHSSCTPHSRQDPETRRTVSQMTNVMKMLILPPFHLSMVCRVLLLSFCRLLR